MIFNLYGMQLDLVTVPKIKNVLKGFKLTSHDLSAIDVFKQTQYQIGNDIFNDGKGWSHDIIYVGY